MNGKSVIIGIIVLVLGVGAGYYFASNYKLTPQGIPVVTPAATEEVVIETSSPTAALTTPTPTVKATPTVDETALLLTAIKAGLIAEHGPSASSMTVTVSKIVGNFAQGGAQDEGGGGMWLAAKVDGKWVLVWDGNGTISCEKTDPYNFPVSILPACWNDATQTIVNR